MWERSEHGSLIIASNGVAMLQETLGDLKDPVSEK